MILDFCQFFSFPFFPSPNLTILFQSHHYCSMPDVQRIAVLHCGHGKAKKFAQGGAHDAKAMKPLQKLCLSSDDVQYAGKGKRKAV